MSSKSEPRSSTSSLPAIDRDLFAHRRRVSTSTGIARFTSGVWIRRGRAPTGETSELRLSQRNFLSSKSVIDRQRKIAAELGQS